jgi:hypothetical protein
MNAVAISCATGICALLFSCASGGKGASGEIGVGRVGRFNIQRQKHCKYGDDGKRPRVVFHDQAAFSD